MELPLKAGDDVTSTEEIDRGLTDPHGPASIPVGAPGRILGTHGNSEYDVEFQLFGRREIVRYVSQDLLTYDPGHFAPRSPRRGRPSRVSGAMLPDGGEGCLVLGFGVIAGLTVLPILVGAFAWNTVFHFNTPETEGVVGGKIVFPNWLGGLGVMIALGGTWLLIGGLVDRTRTDTIGGIAVLLVGVSTWGLIAPAVAHHRLARSRMTLLEAEVEANVWLRDRFDYEASDYQRLSYCAAREGDDRRASRRPSSRVWVCTANVYARRLRMCRVRVELTAWEVFRTKSRLIRRGRGCHRDDTEYIDRYQAEGWARQSGGPGTSVPADLEWRCRGLGRSSDISFRRFLCRSSPRGCRLVLTASGERTWRYRPTHARAMRCRQMEQ